jgi:hypothetical protein
MTVDQAVETILELITEGGSVSFAEIGNRIPGFNFDERDGDGFDLGSGTSVYWVGSEFGAQVFSSLMPRVALRRTTEWTYLADGGAPRGIEPPKHFYPVVLRPLRDANFVMRNGAAVVVADDEWRRIARWIGKAAVVEGKRKARELVALLSEPAR